MGRELDGELWHLGQRLGLGRAELLEAMLKLAQSCVEQSALGRTVEARSRDGKQRHTIDLSALFRRCS
jgi:hypothetical protein